MSFKNGKLAQETQADVLTPEGRIEGLIMALSDFHSMMNLLDVIFKTCFTVSYYTNYVSMYSGSDN